MKIAIVHPFDKARWADRIQTDGLHAALNLIAKDHKVDWWLGGEYPPDSYDWVIPWGVGSLPFNDTIEKYKARKALFCAGHPQDLKNIEKFECVFVESPAVYEAMRPFCWQTVLAFGTDVDLFKPENMDKIFTGFYPATFSAWKRQHLFAQGVGEGGVVCGTLQPDGLEEYAACEEAKVYTLAGLMPSVLVSRLYNLSQACVITGWHGSERTALEAMACNIPVVVTIDNELTCSLLTEEGIIVDPTPEGIRDGLVRAQDRKVHTRDYIMGKYSHYLYAEKIREVIES